MEPCATAHAAMAQLVKPSTGAEPPRALIIVEPKQVPFGAQLAVAAMTYAPQVVLWRFADMDSPRLARWGDAAPMDETRTKPERHLAQGPARPALRLVGDLAPIAPDGGDILDGAPDADDDAVPAASVLSAEELQLLLGVDDIEPSAEGGCGS